MIGAGYIVNSLRGAIIAIWLKLRSDFSGWEKLYTIISFLFFCNFIIFEQTIFVTIKYNTSGEVLWTAKYDGENDTDWPHDIYVDKFDNLYVTGRSFKDDFDYLTLKYDTNGKGIWAVRYDHDRGSEFDDPPPDGEPCNEDDCWTVYHQDDDDDTVDDDDDDDSGCCG